MSRFLEACRTWCIALSLIGLAASTSMAQSGSSADASSGTTGGLVDGGTGTYPGASGGAAMADFDTLINLIQQTVDPDSWLAAGGASSILPYPSGVYVDPKGHLKRLQETEMDGPVVAGVATGPRHPWRTQSSLRTISLKKLDAALRQTAQTGLRPTSELLKLAGLSRIQYVKVDAANEDVLISGPAGDESFGYELQDLAVVTALVNHATNPLGCSIEPTDAGLLAAQEMLQKKGIANRLASNPRMVVEQMQDKIGAHKVHVFGMAPNTGTAIALIDADEHMKKVGFGTVQTRHRVNSYFDYLEKQGEVPQQSMIRWWFSYADSPVRVNQSHDVFELPQQVVAVMSEQQWMTQQGRAPTGGNDEAADAFAEGMTRHLPALRKTHPSYARLCAVFEIGLALQLAVESTGQPSLEAWFPNLCGLGAATPEINEVPRTVEGLTTWHKMKNGTIVAVVSGGVKVDARELAKETQWKDSQFLVASVVPDQEEEPTAAHARWWWDQR